MIFNAPEQARERKGAFILVTKREIQDAVRALGISGRAVCLHSSLRSFGRVDGSAATVVEAFLEEGCTVLVPTFSSVYEISPPRHLRFERNGWNYESDDARRSTAPDKVYSPESQEIDRDMGAIPAAILASPQRVRGKHPLDSFTALGPIADELVTRQAPLDVYAPLRALVAMKGLVLLLGVGLEKMTLLHLAEREAGRQLFRRWANDAQGQPMVVEVGGCSEGFGQLEPHLRSIMQAEMVGRSKWSLLQAGEALARARAAIHDNPQITHCGVASCERCNDAVAGGPLC